MVTFTWEKMAPSLSPSLTAVKGSSLSLSANGRHRSAGTEALRGVVFVICEGERSCYVTPWWLYSLATENRSFHGFIEDFQFQNDEH